MRTVRWVFVILLTACALVMKAPVWFLIARVHLVSGSTGWQRANLIDVFFRHFSDWWLLGTDKQATWGFGNLDDLCEQWIGEGETGGLATFLCFILLITQAFRRLGKARKQASQDPKREWMLWLIGVALFSHCVGYFGISYFDQTRFSWFALLCIISVATSPRPSAARALKHKVKQAQADAEVGENLSPVPIARSAMQNLAKIHPCSPPLVAETTG
jgi:hypothetical protein